MKNSKKLTKGFEIVTKLVKHVTHLLNIELFLFFEENIFLPVHARVPEIKIDMKQN